VPLPSSFIPDTPGQIGRLVLEWVECVGIRTAALLGSALLVVCLLDWLRPRT
jgi:hypothetical protein